MDTKTVVAALLLLLLAPGVSARAVNDAAEEVGVCVKSECNWVDNNGNIYNCESHGNIAIIHGDNNHVNYCHEED